jgi:hypothetical protein
MTDPVPPDQTVTPATPDAVTADLVQAVETLDHLIEVHRATLNQQAELLPTEEDVPVHPDAVPLLVERVNEHGEVSHLPPAAGGDLFADEAAAENPDADPALVTQQLIEELRAVIDAGLSRVAETTRAAVAQELRDTTTGNIANSADDDFAAPEELRTLAHAVDIVLKRHGLGSARQEELYGELIGELGRILRGGLEWLHRNMALAVSNRLQARARRLLHDTTGGDATQQDWLNTDAPAVAAGSQKSDNSPRHDTDHRHH